MDLRGVILERFKRMLPHDTGENEGVGEDQKGRQHGRAIGARLLQSRRAPTIPNALFESEDKTRRRVRVET